MKRSVKTISLFERYFVNIRINLNNPWTLSPSQFPDNYHSITENNFIEKSGYNLISLRSCPILVPNVHFPSTHRTCKSHQVKQDHLGKAQIKQNH